MIKKLSIKWYLGFGMFLVLIMPKNYYAQTFFEPVYIGEMERATEHFNYMGQDCGLYQVKGHLYIALTTLEHWQWSIEEQENRYYLHLPDNIQSEESVEEVEMTLGSAYIAQMPVYCGNIRSYALQVDESLFIPIEALQALGTLKKQDESYYLEEDYQDELALLKINETGIINVSDHIIQLNYQQLYWNGKQFEVIEEEALLDQGEKIEWILSQEPSKLYITTVVSEVNEWPVKSLDTSYYGQWNESLFNQYSDMIYLGKLEKVFPHCAIWGQMKVPVGTLKEKEQVEIYRSEKSYYYVVKDQEGKEHQVPHSSVRIIGERCCRGDQASQEAIEDFATLKQVESETDYLLWADLSRQRLYVLRKLQDKWHLEKRFVCSSGKAYSPTPTGFYEVQYTIPYIGVQKGYRCKYALVFFRDYMFHSVLFDRSGQYIKSGQYELGNKASHGCVRLSEADSKWLYKHIPVKTKVWIR